MPMAVEAPAQPATRRRPRRRGRTEVVVDGPRPRRSRIEVVEEVEAVEAPRLRDRLGKTRATFSGLVGTFRRGGKIDDESWDELEETLLLADVGMTTTEAVVAGVKARAAAPPGRRRRAARPPARRARGPARGHRLRPHAAPRGRVGPTVWLLVGVNGVGKTTTAAKLAKREQADGAAGAPRRRRHLPRRGGRPARDVGRPPRLRARARPGRRRPGRGRRTTRVEAARARDVDVVLVDTAGRLHTKVNLMNELEKLKRIVERTPGALAGGAARARRVHRPERAHAGARVRGRRRHHRRRAHEARRHREGRRGARDRGRVRRAGEARRVSAKAPTTSSRSSRDEFAAALVE